MSSVNQGPGAGLPCLKRRDSKGSTLFGRDKSSAEACACRTVLGRLDGVDAVITRCGRGFGRGIALALGNAGAQGVGEAPEAAKRGSLFRGITGRGKNIP